MLRTDSKLDQCEGEHLAMVYRLARRLRRRLPPIVDLQDLVSDGFIGLRRALRRYDPSRGVPFEAFAGAFVNGAMLDGLRVRQRQTRVAFSSELVEPLLVCDPRFELLHSTREHLRKLLDALPRRRRLVLVLHYFEGLTMRQVGSCLGVTEACVSQLHSRTIKALHGAACGLALSSETRSAKPQAARLRTRMLKTQIRTRMAA